MELTKIQYKIQQIIDNIDNGYTSKSARKCIINPCGSCKKSITKSQKEIQCSICLKNHHLKCNDITDNDAESIRIKGSFWKCMICVLSYNMNNIPFTRLQTSELIDMNGSDSMKFLETLPPPNIIHETTKFTS